MRHFLNGIAVAPRNLTDIGVVSDFTGNPDFLSISVDAVILPREANDIILNHINSVGLFEGIPYSVEMDDGVTLEYYVDLMDGVKVRQHEIEVKLKKRTSKDNFFARAEGTSWELLAKKGVNFQTYDVPYFVVRDNAFQEALQIFVILYIMTQALIDAGDKLLESINKLIEATIPIPVAPAGVGFNVPAIVGASLMVVARVIYFGLLLSAVLELATQFILIVFPPKRKLKGVYFRELMDKACEHFGYTFESDLLDSQPFWTLVPVPLVRDRDSVWNLLPDDIFPVFNNGYPSSSDSTPSVLTFIQALETMFNGRTFVIGNVVRIERRDWLQSQTQNQIVPAMTLQAERDDEFSYNLEDVWKRYYIHYQVDFQDVHTADGKTYDAHDSEYSTEPTFTIQNQDLVQIQGLNDVSIPFSLGARKDKLNFIEKIGQNLLVFIDELNNTLGGSSNFAQIITSRKDCLQISQTYFSNTKVIYGQAGAVLSNQIITTESDFNNIVKAEALYDNFHTINEIVNNDFIIRENVRIRISSSEFVSLLENNFAEINGKICEILRLEWIDEKSFAQITYKEPLDWANGKVETLRVN
tara:strand:- start:2927 stop:4678 length:1752 start_codon:yes stop_codon:yes gene_type:complete